VHPKHQTREESRTTWKSSPKCSTYERLELIISREREDRAWHQSAIMRQAMEGKNSSHRRTRFPQMLAGNSRRVGVQGTSELQTQKMVVIEVRNPHRFRLHDLRRGPQTVGGADRGARNLQ